MGDALQLARYYTRAGWRVVPIAFREKRPPRGMVQWEDLRLDDGDLERYFNGAPQNVGVLLGEPSGGLIDIDLDCPEAIELAPHILPTTPVTFGRTSKPRSHFLYRSPGASTERFFQTTADRKRHTLVELRSTGGQTVFPGSTHVGGESVEWSADMPDSADLNALVPTVDGATLRNRVVLLAAGCLLMRQGESAVRAVELVHGPLRDVPGEAGREVRRWLGVIEAKPLASTTTPRVRGDLDDAVRAWNLDHPREFPTNSGECPVCQDSHSFGRLPKAHDRWSCHSTDHPDNVGLAGENCFHGDVLDLESYERNMTRVEVLRSDGYLATPASPSPTPGVPPPPPVLYGACAIEFLGDEDDTDDDSQDWIVRGLILRAAPNIIAGTPKGKKTMVGLHLMISIAAAKPSWLGRFPIRAGRVLVLAHEDSKRETRRRLWRLARGMGIDPRSLDQNLRIADASEPFHFDSDKEMSKMVATIETWRPTTIFMDSLSRMHLADENSKREMNVVTAAWLTLAAKYDLAIVSVHHLVKIAETKDLILQLRGTGDIGAAVRHAVGVAKTKDPDRSRLWTDGNEPYQPEPFEIVVSDDSDAHGKPTIVIHADDAEDSQTKIITAKILAALATEPHTSRQLRKLCGGRGTTVDEVTRSLENARQIRRLAGDGPWLLCR